MRRMREIIGLPVYKQQTGERLGWIKDILFDDKSNIVTGIILEKDSLLNSGTQRVARKHILACLKDCFFVDYYESGQVPGTSWSKKIGNQVYDREGEAKGTVGDIFVDNKVETVLGYEVTDGLFADLFNGREAVFEENIIAESQDIIVVEGGSLS